MNRSLVSTVLSLSLVLSLCRAAPGVDDETRIRKPAGVPLNSLTQEEVGSGWKLLFDGTSTRGWRAFKQATFPDKGWKVEDGLLKKLPKVRGGDIISEETFDQFDLRWEWRIAKNGNNGVKYFITEERSAAIGHEYQMIDDEGHPDGRAGPKHQTASFYDVLPAETKNALRPPEEWNQSRVLVDGNRVEHWLNGERVLTYQLESDTVKSGVAQSKFRNVPGFGTRLKGHILLTDHEDECWFRNIKIRDLSLPR